MKNCMLKNEMLHKYIENELTDKEKIQFEKHLLECSECKTEYMEITSIINMYAELPEEELPEGFHGALHQKLLEATDSGQSYVADSKNRTGDKRIPSEEEPINILNYQKLKIFSYTAAAVILLAIIIQVGNFGYFKQKFESANEIGQSEQVNQQNTRSLDSMSGKGGVSEDKAINSTVVLKDADKNLTDKAEGRSESGTTEYTAKKEALTKPSKTNSIQEDASQGSASSQKSDKNLRSGEESGTQSMKNSVQNPAQNSTQNRKSEPTPLTQSPKSEGEQSKRQMASNASSALPESKIEERTSSDGESSVMNNTGSAQNSAISSPDNLTNPQIMGYQTQKSEPFLNQPMDGQVAFVNPVGISVTVDNPESAKSTILNRVKELGYQYEIKDQNTANQYIEVMLKRKDYDGFLKELSGVGKVASPSIASSDLEVIKLNIFLKK